MKSIEDYLICDKCGYSMHEFYTDEVEFTSDYHKCNIRQYYGDNNDF